MKKLFLHIGLAKTGSSALQSWLSLNSEALLQQGIEYADTAPEAKHGTITSGNGFILLQALRGNDFEEAERLLNTVLSTQSCENFIVSCEQLQSLAEPKIRKLKEIFEKHSIDVTVVAFVRSFYEVAYSSYSQSVKRAGATHRFNVSDIAEINQRRTEFLKRYLRIFVDDLVVLNYDDPDIDIYSSFAKVAGIDTSTTKIAHSRVNRSLSFDEIELLRQLNGLHKGVFSTAISNHLIQLQPDLKTAVHYESAFVKSAREDTKGFLRWIEEQFKLTPPLLSDKYQDQSDSDPVSLNKDSYTPVVEWALVYNPPKKQEAPFAQFLYDFSSLLSSESPQASAKIEARLKEYNRAGVMHNPNAETVPA